jgi:hypothetical protein
MRQDVRMTESLELLFFLLGGVVLGGTKKDVCMV